MNEVPGVLHILMVEDNRADVVFFKEAVEVVGEPVRVQVVRHGEEALRVLRREEPLVDAAHPDVLVLDLNLPLMNGRELLAEMMADDGLRGIPVAVLTTSTSDGHIRDMCPPGQCLYFSKTHDFGLMQQIVRQILAHAR